MSAYKKLTRWSASLAAAAALLSTGCGKGPVPCKNSGDICTVAGSGTAGFTGDGQPAWAADLYYPMDMTVGPDKLLYIVDWNNHRIRRVEANGTIKTVAGSGELGDGTGQEALASSFNHPTNITFDSKGRMIIAAWHNSRLKRLDLATGALENIAGTGKRWYSGDNGPAQTADFDLPSSVAYGPDGGLYFVDQANQLIRKMDTAGNISRVAGQCIIGKPAMPGDMPVPCPQGPGIQANEKQVYGLEANPTACQDYQPCTSDFGGDNGPALEARLGQPVGQAASPGGRLVFDKAGDLIFADTKNNRIRKIDTSGKISTIAGTGTRAFSGDNGPATAANIGGAVDVDVAADGTVYFADTTNNCIRSIGADGNIHTVAGQCGVAGDTGDGAPATAAMLDTPYGIAFDGEGNLYIADTMNSRIRMVKK
jgi:sugar lactone lactonase YvrE